MRLKPRLRPILSSIPLRVLTCTIVIIGVGVLTVVTNLFMQQRVLMQTDIKFAEITDSYIHQLSQHIEGSSNLLYATRGLFAATDVDASAWNRFIQTQHSFERYPGMEVVGYAEVVSQQEKPGYLKRVRDEQNMPTTIYPEKTEGDHIVLTYLKEAKPATPRHTEAYGFDLQSEPVRREALEQARTTGTIAATAPIHLVTTGKPGFLVAIPLIDKNANGQNAANTIGYGVAAFDVPSLIDTVLGPHLERYKSSMTINDITGAKPLPLYSKAIKASGRMVQRDVTLQVANRTWQITSQAPASTMQMVTDRLAPTAVLVGGIVLILSAGVLFYTLGLRKKLQ